MNIAESKARNTLPKRGTRVKVVDTLEFSNCDGFLIHHRYIDNRRASARGVYWDYVPGAGGDLWWVRHDDGKVAAYGLNEVEDEPNEETETPEANQAVGP
jgi:hypothetical protein